MNADSKKVGSRHILSRGVIVQVMPLYDLCHSRRECLELSDFLVCQLRAVGFGIRQLEMVMDKTKSRAHCVLGPLIYRIGKCCRTSVFTAN